MRLLLAEDEKEYSRALAALLIRTNYAVDAVYNGSDALDYALTGQYDGIILDILMPCMDGIEVLRQLRNAEVAVPVLLLTAKNQMDDRIAGYDAGADDYLPKPFHSAELLARVRALLRRHPTFTPDILSFGDISINGITCSLTGTKGTTRLQPKEYQMLELLMRNSCHTVSTEKFMEKVWGLDTDTEISAVWVHMSYLRKKLALVSDEVKILAFRSVGYLLATVREQS